MVSSNYRSDKLFTQKNSFKIFVMDYMHTENLRPRGRACERHAERESM